MDRNESLELLRQQHAFPGPFDFRVVVKKGTSAHVVSALAAGAGADAVVENVTTRLSRKGTYEAVVIRMRVGSAERVLDVYALLPELPNVVTAL